MPCYDPPSPYDWHQKNFPYAALCHAVEFLSDEEIDAFPGLRSWKIRHDYVDELVAGGMDRWQAEQQYREVHDDENSRDTGLRYVEEYKAAFPDRHDPS